MSYDPPRRTVRTETTLEIVIHATSAPVSQRIADLSEGGAFVDTAHPLNEGEEFGFEFSIAGDDEPISGRATVVWVQPGMGMGVRFDDLSDEDRERLRFFVASVFFEV